MGAIKRATARGENGDCRNAMRTTRYRGARSEILVNFARRFIRSVNLRLFEITAAPIKHHFIANFKIDEKTPYFDLLYENSCAILRNIIKFYVK